MQQLMFIHITINSADGKPQIKYMPNQSEGLSSGPFFIPLQMTYKDHKGRWRQTTLNARCGILATGAYFAEAQPIDKKGTCVGCILKTLVDNKAIIWHFIQAKAKPM